MNYVKTLQMKSTIKFFSLSFLTFLIMTVSNAQLVDFNDLMNDKSNSEVNTSKKWIKEFTEAKDNSIAKEVLSLELVKMTKSKHWFSLSDDSETTKELSFQTSKRMLVDKVIENLKEAGFELVNTKCSIDCKTFIYSKNSFTIEVLALETETTTQTVYLVTLL